MGIHIYSTNTGKYRAIIGNHNTSLYVHSNVAELVDSLTNDETYSKYDIIIHSKVGSITKVTKRVSKQGGRRFMHNISQWLKKNKPKILK